MFSGSPAKQRITSLLSKVDNFEPRPERNNKVDSLEERCHGLQDKMSHYIEANNKEIKGIKEQISNVQKLLLEERRNREITSESRSRDLSTVEARITNLIENEMNAKKESDHRLNHIINLRYTELKDQLRRESIIREENLNLINTTLESDLPKLNEAIRNENDELVDSKTKITKKFQDEIKLLKELVDQERTEREDSEKTIQEMLKSVFAKVREDIEQEAKSRETTEEALTNLLDETCKKINDASHS